MNLSSKLLNTLKGWEIVLIPETLHHGCRTTDRGVDVVSSSISGNKWFSVCHAYAGEYAWHWSREPFTGQPLRATVQVKSDLRAVQRPSGIDFPALLSACFPQVAATYSLSKHFQDVLACHLAEAFDGSVHAYSFSGHKEVLITSCENWITTASFATLPADKDSYTMQFETKE